MRLKMIDGTIIEGIGIKKAPANIHRQYGFEKIARWTDAEKKMPCSVPVERTGYGTYKEIL